MKVVEITWRKMSTGVPIEEGRPTNMDEGGAPTMDEEGSVVALDEGISMDARAHVHDRSGDEGDWNEFIGDEGAAAMNETSGDEGGPILDEESGVSMDEQGEIYKMKELMQAKLIEIQNYATLTGARKLYKGICCTCFLVD